MVAMFLKQFTTNCEVKNMQELLRVKNNLMRVIAENNHYIAEKCLESVKAYNQQLTKELETLNRLIKGVNA